jgi:hypothetical protein
LLERSPGAARGFNHGPLLIAAVRDYVGSYADEIMSYVQ